MLDSPSQIISAAAIKPDTGAIKPSATSPNSGERSGSLGLFDRWSRDSLTWIPQRGLGYSPATATYDGAYFANYAARADSEIGRQLNAARLAFLARHWEGDGVVDVGIGCGAFVAARPGTMGYDINPVGVAWLRERGLFLDPYQTPVNVACFFDSLEHIANPAPLLANVRERVLVAIPIFHDLPHVLRSKHYKDEHCWYFSARGFLGFMFAHGWHCVESNDEETRIGREDIKSYAFRRA